MKKEVRPKPKLAVQVDLSKAEKYNFVPKLSNVFFPYEPYPQQIDIVTVLQKSVNNNENALIQSPTGTGKTLCLLIGVLSSLVDAPFRKKVYYLTRTHSQISQVVSEFKITVYKCHLNIIASREQFCINHNLSKLKGRLLEKACEELCAQQLCTYKEMMGAAKRPRESLDLQSFKDFCKKEMTCPYFFSKQLTEKTELTILPFNYLLDWSLFQKSSLDLKDSIIIFDEAHNIDSLCQQGSDVKLPLDLLSQVVSQLKSLVRAQNSKTLHAQFKDKYEDRQDTIEFKLQLEFLISKIKSISESEVLSRHDLLGKLEEFTTTSKREGLDLGNFRDFVSTGKKITKSCYKKQIQCESLHAFLIVIQKIYQILGCEEEFQKFSIRLSKNQLFFRCLDPSLCFSRLIESKPRSIILSSGTLGDLTLWQKNLKIKFHNKISAESFVTPLHLFAQVKSRSQKGVPFNFSFQGKQNDEQYQSIFFELKTLETIVKGGIVVAFSTYELLEKIVRFCSSLKNKVFFQTKGGNIEQVYSQFQKEVRSGTSFLFIVMKGRFSEGINFTGSLCRCLILIGIPFLPLKDPGVIEKMKYLENNYSRAQAQQWYTMESFKSLNQTLGRAIRNKTDYAVILLYDQRFNKDEYQNHLSKWFTRCLRPYKNGFEEIKQFLAKAEDNIMLESKAKTSSKNKKQLTLCDRLAEFSTPNKSKKCKKLKLVLESEQKSSENIRPLKEIKIVEEQQYYNSMTKHLQEYFIDFSELEREKTIKKQVIPKDPLQIDEDTLVKGKNDQEMIKIMRSYCKYKESLDF